MTATLPDTTVAALRRVTGDEDLSDGLCQQMDPDIWAGDWVDKRVKSKAARAARDRHVTRAARICADCPVLAACERQLAHYEAAGEPVTGVMAGREFTPPVTADRDRGICARCGRPMISIVAALGHQPDPPEGTVYFMARGLCRTCAKHSQRTRTTTGRHKEKTA